MGKRSTTSTIYVSGTPAATPVSGAGGGGLRYDAATNQWMVSANAGAWVPIATGVVTASPWQQTGTVVDLVDPAVTSVNAALADAAGGSGNPGGDFEVEPGQGDGGGRAGELRVTRNIEVREPTQAGASDVLLSQYASPAYWGGVYLQDGAIAHTSALGFTNIPGPWTGVLGDRGDVVADPFTPRIRLGITNGLWLVHYSVTWEATDGGTFTFAANFGGGAVFAGHAAESVVAGQTRSVSGFACFVNQGINEDVQLAMQAPGDPAPAASIIHAHLVARRIS